MGLTHVHLGASEVGIGLIVLTCVDCDLSEHLVVSNGEQLDMARLSVKIHDGDGSLEERDPIGFCSLSTADRLDDDLLEALGDSEDLLVTTELDKAGFAACADLIERLFEARPADLIGSTVLIVGESCLGETGERLVERLVGRGVDCRKTVAGRVCYVRTLNVERVTEPAVEAAGSPSLHVDAKAEWVIEGEPDRAVLAALAGMDHITFSNAVEPYGDRRRWLYEGPELALALWAHRKRQTTLRHAARDSEGRMWVGHYFVPVLELLNLEHPSLAGSAEYAYEHLDVWARHDRDVTEVLELFRRSDLMPMLDRLDCVLVEPIEKLHRHGMLDWERMGSTVTTMHFLMKDIANYGDYSELERRDAVLTEQGDAAVIERYGTIVEKVFPSSFSMSMASELERAFTNHRRLYN